MRKRKNQILAAVLSATLILSATGINSTYAQETGTSDVVTELLSQDQTVDETAIDQIKAVLFNCTDHGLREFPGGKVEPGETREQALVRECQEELDVTISVGDCFYEVEHVYSDVTIHLTLFWARLAQGTPKRLEHHAFAWIPPQEIGDYVFCPADEEILDVIRTRNKEGTLWPCS